ncbi:DUF58 domain-containing protein [Pontibacter akesuensis]|uniref:DUF58 domain-containing protein n=1 Tax=Pontibacter akesuensis TaxID=388950 RepID=A0A1I7I7B9_9BACT|nr:DUF58 domain-containing protein [Pontibacter akesuensis]GHA65584.1 hypothetical protein GCM10007389_18090 [Pontibacter akesuensis]SFU68801.1 Protein of unknown function DUF58 [Pontibacter akesuensis]
MADNANKFIDPKVLATIKNLPLLAKTVVEGFLAGQNQSLRRGAGLEFSQYRSYQPGDDLRQLDWKMFARSDRYYIREAEVDTNITVRFILDGSASMGHEDGNGISKMDYARFLVASLAYLATTQGDAVGLYVLHENQLINLTPRSDNMHLQRFWHQLTEVKPQGKFPDAQAAANLFADRRQKELTVFLTDLYEQEAEITDLLFKLGAQRHELLLFHLMSRNELEFAYDGTLTFEDLETGQTLQVSTSTQRNTYLQRLQEWLTTTEREMRNRQIVYNQFISDEPLDKALRTFLQQRLAHI